jgi:hypothetical protein
MSSRANLLSPEIVERIRGVEPALNEYSDQQLSDVSALIAAALVSIESQPESLIFAAMGRRATLIYIANSFANAFLGMLVKEGIINPAEVGNALDTIIDGAEAGKSASEIHSDLWGDTN